MSKPEDVFTDPVVDDTPAFTDPVVEDSTDFTDPVVSDPSDTFTDPVVEDSGFLAKSGREIVAQGREIATQAAAGVVRDLPRMIWQTAQAVLPGEGPSPQNPQGSGAAGFAGQTVQEIDQREQNATWDDAKKQGWSGVAGMAARSLAPNLLVGVATGGMGVAALPVLYGGSRAQEVFSRLRDKAQTDGTPFDETTARLNAFGAGGLEGGLEYISNMFGMNKQIRGLMGQLAKPGEQAVKAAAPEISKRLAAGLRKLAGNMAAEGSTEFVQEGGGQLHEQLLGISQMIEEQPQSLAAVNWNAVWDQAKLAAAAGALGSAATGGMQGALRQAQERRDAGEVRSKREEVISQEEQPDSARPIDGLAEQDENEDPYPGAEESAQPQTGTEDTGSGTSAEAVAPENQRTEAGGQRTALTPEQEEQATRQAEENAKKDYAKRKVMGANVSDGLMESNAVKAMVLERGGIRMDGTEDQRGIPVAFRSKNPNAHTADTMLTDLQRGPEGEKYADWTTDDLIDALKGKETEKRKRFTERQADPEERAWLKSAWTVAPENLAIGFNFKVKGIDYRVVDSDESGYVIERTDGANAGWAIRLDHGKMMNIDGGTLTNAAGKKLSKIKNYADPDQVRMWEDAGADAALQKDEGYSTGEDEDQTFRADGRGQRTEDGKSGKISDVNKGTASGTDISAKTNADRDAEIIHVPTAQELLSEVLNRPKSVDKAPVGGRSGENSLRALEAKERGLVDLSELSELTGYPIEDLMRVIPSQEAHHADGFNGLTDFYSYPITSLETYALQHLKPTTENIGGLMHGITSYRALERKHEQLKKEIKNAFDLMQNEEYAAVYREIGALDSAFYSSFGKGKPDNRQIENHNKSPKRQELVSRRNKISSRLLTELDGKANKEADGGLLDYIQNRINKIVSILNFNRHPGDDSGQDTDTSYRTSTAKPVAQIRVVRRGYDENREAADDPTFTQWAQNPVDLPELVEMATDLMDGKVPRVLKSMPANSNAVGYAKFKGEQNAAGQAVFGRPEVIALLAANYKLVSDDEAETMQAAAETKAWELVTGNKEEVRGKTSEEDKQRIDALTKQIFDEVYYAEVKSRVAAGPRFAMAVIAHEIGHLADQAAKYGLVKPDRSQGKNRLNLIGRVAGMLSWTRDILADDPSGKTLSADEIRTLQGRARKNAKPDTRGKELMQAITQKWATMPELNELAANPQLVNLVNARSFRDALEYMARDKPVLSEWFSITTFPEQVRASMEALKSLTTQSKTSRHLGSAWFRAEFVKGLEAQRQAHLGKMYSELESLIAWWNNGDKTMMDKYYERPSEMFAEAFGVYLNNPGAVKKRAPMFWRTLLDYMSTRPEVQEWLDAFNQDMARGPHAKYDVRDDRLTDMFSRYRREQNRAVEQAGQAGVTKRLAADAARYMLSRKSGPLHALISTADALGLAKITNRVGKWADQVENVAGLEKMFAGEMNEVGQILEEGGLNVEDFDKWAYLNMVAQSPAYTQRANPLGFHPQAAREQLDFLRRQMGDARTNQLQKAVERFQKLWLANVVDRVDGMYDEATMTQLRANPVYFTLMVGMDDAEIKAFQTALQTLNADQMLAYAQRTVNNSVFGQPVPGGIIRRVGTHRPAMSLFGATLLKGVRMINDATRNRLAIETRSLMETLKDPYFMDIPEGQTATDTRSQTVVRYFENGVKKAYYAPKYVGHFLRGDNPIDAANSAMEVLRKYTAVNIWKRLQTMWSLRFMATQPIADAKAWNTQMPGVRTPIGNVARGNVMGGLAQMLPASTWYLPASVFPPNSRERLMRPAREVIRRFYKTGEIDPRLRDLVERGMTDLNGAFNGVSLIDPDAGEILQLFAGIKPSKALEVYQQDLNAFQRGWQKLETIPAFGKLFQTIGRTAEGLQSEMQVETLANKLSGMEYLDAKYPAMSERDKRSWVLHAAGNPNFAARAGADPFVDTLAWTFYNPAKEGYRSLYMAAKADPAGFMARAMWFNVAPNLIKWGATTGILAAVAESIIPHGATPEDEEDRKRYMDALKNWLGWFKRLPSYYGRRYVTIPIQPIGEDSVLTITIPQAQSLAPINGLVNAMLDEMAQLTGNKSSDNKFAERAITAVTDEISGLNFLSGNNRSAFVQVFGPLIEMLTTDKTNVYDPFYGRNVFDKNEESLMAGGRFTLNAMPAWKKLGKNAWNNSFGSAIGRFDTKTPRSDMPSNTQLQNILSAPGMSTIVGGLLRVTGGGEFERMEDMFSAEGQNRAYDNIMVRKAALDTLNDPQRRFPTWAAEKYMDDPVFLRNWNEYIISHDIYSGMSVEDRMLYGRSNPIWKRMMLLREQQKRGE